MLPNNLGRLAASDILTAAVLASAASCSQKQQQVSQSKPNSPNLGDLQAELKRCHDLGVHAADDPKCQEAWNRSNAHFFGTDQSRTSK